jgi:tetratricopeptide (TPR) repeat protein
MERRSLFPAAGLFFICATACASGNLERAAQSVVLIRAEVAAGRFQQGSGIVLTPEIVATNAHVVKDAYRIRVIKDDRSWQAVALCLAPDRDLVLLRLAPLPLPPAEPAPRGTAVEGLPVVALGYPGGMMLHPDQGKITALWSFRGDHLIQTDTHNRPGSSGGGLFTEDGKLLGVTTFNLPHPGRLDFAVPADWLLSLLENRAGAPDLRCPLVVVDRLLLNFSDLLAEDPANLRNWLSLTRRWVETDPLDAEGWFSRATALEGLLAADPPAQPEIQPILDAYARAVELNPGHARAWNNLGAFLDTLNRFKEAQRAFRKAVQVDPSYGLAWLNLGSSLLNTRDFGEASRVYATGLKLHGDDPQSWARLGYCELNLGLLPEAVAHYRLALHYAPFHAEWWGEIHKACLALHRGQEAREALERVQALAPDLARELQKEPAPRGRAREAGSEG